MTSADKTMSDHILADHRSFRELYDRFRLAAVEKDRSSIINELIREVSQHSVAKELVLYPTLVDLSKKRGGVDFEKHIQHERHEHQRVELRDESVT